MRYRIDLLLVHVAQDSSNVSRDVLYAPMAGDIGISKGSTCVAALDTLTKLVIFHRIIYIRSVK